MIISVNFVYSAWVCFDVRGSRASLTINDALFLSDLLKDWIALLEGRLYKGTRSQQ